MNVEELSERDIEWADIVFLSAMIVQQESLDKVVGVMQKTWKTGCGWWAVCFDEFGACS